MRDKLSICVVGLGYVGLPVLAACVSAGYKSFGFDINTERVNRLPLGHDPTCDLSLEELSLLGKAHYTSDIRKLSDCNIFIVCVPTPVDEYNNPNLKMLLEASGDIAKVLKKDDIIIYESTVYPGVTRNKCVPHIEKLTNMKLGIDFYVGYSPERINPGDKKRKINNIVKITSGSDLETAKIIDEFYQSIIKAGTYMAPSIEVAEAAKVIENVQRDVNIALINELQILFDRVGISVFEVLKAAKTKWNFLDFQPGLVGGHCIGVDPYYLTHLASKYDFHARIISSGRIINDSMASYYAEKIVKLILKNTLDQQLPILILGLTFKENVSDLRNSKVFDLIDELSDYSLDVKIFDPLIKKTDLVDDYKELFTEDLNAYKYSAVVVAVGHEKFFGNNFHFLKKERKNGTLIIDLKNKILNE